MYIINQGPWAYEASTNLNCIPSHEPLISRTKCLLLTASTPECLTVNPPLRNTCCGSLSFYCMVSFLFLYSLYTVCVFLYCFPPVLHSIKKWRENEYVKEILFRKSYNDLLYVRVLISAVVLPCVWMVWEDSLQEQVPSYLVDPGDPI